MSWGLKRICMTVVLASGCPLAYPAEPLGKPLPETIKVQGIIRSPERATISSRAEGMIDAYYVKTGSKVKKNDTLFQVDLCNLEDRVLIAEQDLLVTEIDLENRKIDLEAQKATSRKSEIDFQRADKLRSSRLISENDYESRYLDYQIAQTKLRQASAAINYAEAKVEQQKRNLTIARKNLSDSRVAAPFDGTVTTRHYKLGEYVSRATAVLHLANYDKLEIYTHISTMYYHRITPGKTKVRLHQTSGQVLEAVITYRAPSSDAASRTFETKAWLGSKPELVYGMMYDMEIILDDNEG